MKNLWNALLAAAPVRFWAMILACPVLTLFAYRLVMIVWRGGWDRTMQPKQLDFLGSALIVCLFMLGVIIAALAAARVKATGLGGASLEVDPEDTSVIKVEAKASIEN